MSFYRKKIWKKIEFLQIHLKIKRIHNTDNKTRLREFFQVKMFNQNLLKKIKKYLNLLYKL